MDNIKKLKDIILELNEVTEVEHIKSITSSFKKGGIDYIKILSKEEILKQLQEKTVSCKDVTFRIFGLSLTSINILLSLVLITLLIKIYISYEKYK